MRILYVYCHPLPESFHAGLRAEALAGLAEAGHEVDLLDLYAEGFDPVLSEEGRRHYHDTAKNRTGLEEHVDRLMKAEGFVVQFPTWCFGFPAMLKGYFDRLFMPGVGFDIADPAHVKPLLGHIRKVAGISTYGRPRWRAIAMADPPRKMVKRYLRWYVGPGASVDYHALYHMNVATAAQREVFKTRVRTAMARF